MPAEKHRFEIQGSICMQVFSVSPCRFFNLQLEVCECKGPNVYTMLYRALEHTGGSCNQFPVDTKGQLKFWESQKVYVDADFQLLRDPHPDSLVIQGSKVVGFQTPRWSALHSALLFCVLYSWVWQLRNSIILASAKMTESLTCSSCSHMHFKGQPHKHHSGYFYKLSKLFMKGLSLNEWLFMGFT